MAQTVSNVTVGKPAAGGAVYRAPLGTTLPTDASTALGESFVALGYCSEDGLTNNNSPESDSVKAWGGDTVLTFQTGKEDTFSFTLIEALNLEVLKTIYGESNVTGTLAAGVSVDATADEPTEYVWVFDMIGRDNTAIRIVVPDGKISEIGEISYTDSDAVGFDVTLTAMPVNGKTHHQYIKGNSGT